MKFKYIGKDVIRPDAVSKITGKSVFLDDIKLPGMLYASLLVPEYAHAEIVAIDTSEAEKSEGVVQVVTGKNCKFKFGDNIRDRSPLAVDRVRYIGEPVAAVVAESPRQAKMAVKKIKAEYKPLPVYTDAIAALKKDAALIHPDSPKFWHLPGMGAVPGTNIACRYVLKKATLKNYT